MGVVLNFGSQILSIVSTTDIFELDPSSSTLKKGGHWQCLARFIYLQSQQIKQQNVPHNRFQSQATWDHLLPCPLASNVT